MEIIKFINDKLVYCVTAKSFADGIVDAHKTLNKQIPVQPKVNYFGITYFNWK
ncbi:MAG: hypothetical protein KDC52_12445 [Ignavibacteriae bacterium]|nr:hypothetical protein [Ignavibacteriota bacterium]